MKSMLRWTRRLRFTCAGLLLCGTVVGCKTCDSGCDGGGGHTPCLDRNCFDKKCATITPGSLPQPNGTYVRMFQDLQAAKAEEDDFVIYLNEWFMGGAVLGPYGEYHLGQIIQRLPEVPFAVLIQTSPSAALNQTRHTLIVNLLTKAGITDAAVRVKIGYPAAEGLDANESERIYLQYLQNYGEQADGGHHTRGAGFGGSGYGGLGGGGAGAGFGGTSLGGFGRGGFGSGR